jgi:serine/threonine-protein kinase
MAVLSGRYELGKAVGNGGMGDVYEAYDQKLSRRVAVKCLKPGFTGSHHERFVREVRHAAAFIHPNVVTVFDVGDDEGSPYFVMELVEGRTLAAELKATGPLPAAEAVRIADAVLAGLAAAHARDLVHRDVKPANVLLGADGSVKLADFGIAKAVHDASPGLTAAHDIIGTPTYLSPEQANGDPTGPGTDLYAVGLLLYEMLAGAPPFRGDSPMATALAHRDAPVPPLAEQRPDVPNRLARVIERALEKDPADRFADAEAMRAALADAVPSGAAPADEPTAEATTPIVTSTRVLPVPPSPPSRTTRTPASDEPPAAPPAAPARRTPGDPRRRRRVLPALAAFVVVLLLGTGVALALSGGGTDLGDAAAPARRAQATAASKTQASTTSTTVTTIPTPRSIAELFTVLVSNPSAYGRRGPELADKLGKVVTGRDEDGSEARKLTQEIPKWVAAGELDPEVGNLTVQLLGPYLGGSPFRGDEATGGDDDGDQGSGKDHGKGGD